MFDFDKGVERRGTSCIKWDMLDGPFARFKGENLIPMWIADMDFAVAPAITEAIRKKADQAAYGYTFLSDRYYDAVINWMKTRHSFDVKKEEIIFMPSVNPALDFALKALTQPGDEVLVEVPVYGPFYRVIAKNGCTLVETPLKNDNEHYSFDFEDLESKITDKTKVFMLCSPHNPTGRVWTREELTRLAEICEKHDIYVIADEIHNDLIIEGEHIVFATINDWTATHTVTCTAPTKTFNLASLLDSNIIVKDPVVRDRMKEITTASYCDHASFLVEPVVTAAYGEGAPWLDELTQYIKGNRDYVCEFMKTHLPELKIHPMEGTYLGWLNCEALGLRGDELKDFMSEKCGVAMNNGSFFGEKWNGYCRMNMACPRSSVEEACRRIERGVRELLKK